MIKLQSSGIRHFVLHHPPNRSSDVFRIPDASSVVMFEPQDVHRRVEDPKKTESSKTQCERHDEMRRQGAESCESLGDSEGDGALEKTEPGNPWGGGS